MDTDTILDTKSFLYETSQDYLKKEVPHPRKVVLIHGGQYRRMQCIICTIKSPTETVSIGVGGRRGRACETFYKVMGK